MKTKGRIVPGEEGILSRVLGNGRRKMSPALARHVLTLGFDEDDQKRMGELAARNQLGHLSERERDELLEYVRAANVLALLHSRARLALNSSAKLGSKEAVLKHFGIFKKDHDLEAQLASIRKRRKTAGE